MNGMATFGASAALFPENATDAMIGSLVRSMNHVVPARVIAYDRTTHRVQVEPLVRNFDNNKYADCPFYICTVWRMYCGQYLIDVPIDVGDTGWLISADRDTTTVKELCVHSVDGDLDEWKQQNPYTDMCQSFEFGFFIPDRWGGDFNRDAEHNAQLTGSSEDADRLVIQSADGNQKISMRHYDDSDKGEIKITSIDTSDTSKKTTIVIKNGVITVETATETNVTSPKINVKAEAVKVEAQDVNVTASKSIAVHCPDVTYDGNTNFKINGLLTVSGNIVSTGGEITEKTGINLGTHTHKYNPGVGTPIETITPTVP